MHQSVPIVATVAAVLSIMNGMLTAKVADNLNDQEYRTLLGASAIVAFIVYVVSDFLLNHGLTSLASPQTADQIVAGCCQAYAQAIATIVLPPFVIYSVMTWRDSTREVQRVELGASGVLATVIALFAWLGS